jgi:hypothetical protein
LFVPTRSTLPFLAQFVAALLERVGLWLTFLLCFLVPAEASRSLVAPKPTLLLQQLHLPRVD